MSSTEIITIKQCLAWMESGQPFSCKVVAYDRKRKKGGEIIHHDEAVLLQREKEEVADTARPLTEVEKMREKLAGAARPETSGGRNPRHRLYYTRNIRILQDGHPTGIIRKLHPPLLLQFNEKTVVP